MTPYPALWEQMGDAIQQSQETDFSLQYLNIDQLMNRV